ncbi:hypothetical protein ACFL6Y_11990 [Elusimicrobiota bacterium]
MKKTVIALIVICIAGAVPASHGAEARNRDDPNKAPEYCQNIASGEIGGEGCFDVLQNLPFKKFADRISRPCHGCVSANVRKGMQKAFCRQMIYRLTILEDRILNEEKKLEDLIEAENCNFLTRQYDAACSDIKKAQDRISDCRQAHIKACLNFAANSRPGEEAGSCIFCRSSYKDAGAPSGKDEWAGYNIEPAAKNLLAKCKKRPGENGEHIECATNEYQQIVYASDQNYFIEVRPQERSGERLCTVNCDTKVNTECVHEALETPECKE